jgi:hypothetical protein
MLLLGFAAVLAPASARAQEHLVRFRDAGTVLSVACNGSLTTTAVPTDGMSAVTWLWALTDANSSAATVTATCVGTGAGDSDASTTYKVPVNSSTSAAGTATYVQLTYSFAPSGTNASYFTTSVIGHRYAKCTFACGGAAADSIIVKATVTAP